MNVTLKMRINVNIWIICDEFIHAKIILSQEKVRINTLKM